MLILLYFCRTPLPYHLDVDHCNHQTPQRNNGQVPLQMFGFVFVDFHRKFNLDSGQVHFLLGRSCGLDPQRHSKRQKNMIIDKRQEYKKISGLQIGEGDSTLFVRNTYFKFGWYKFSKCTCAEHKTYTSSRPHTPI